MVISSHATVSRCAFQTPVPGNVFPSQLCPSVERNRKQVKQVQASAGLRRYGGNLSPRVAANMPQAAWMSRPPL
jgi:hypothetical protein